MRLSDYFQSMYVWTILLLAFLAVVASYARDAFPTNLLVAVIAAAVLDVGIKKIVLKRKISAPLSAIITGIIIGSIAPFNASPLIVIIAASLAILSKFIIRFKDLHIFNPAALGLVISLFLFSLGDEWWAAVGYNVFGYAITLTPLLIFANYRAMKLKVSLPFLLTVAVLSHLTGIIRLNSFDPADTLRFLVALPYYFGFIMVSEPRTSPYQTKEQISFGVSVAVLTVILTLYSVAYALFLALLIGNLGYALYRSKTRKEA